MDKRPFVILFQERSGSTHLRSLLDSHPDITCRAEDFDFSYDNPPSRVAGDRASGDWTPGPSMRRKVSGFQGRIDDPSRDEVEAHLDEIFYGQPTTANGFKYKHPNQTSGYPEINDRLTALGDRLHVVYLDRENVLKRAVSRQVLVRLRNGGKGTELRNANLVSARDYEALRIDVPEAIRYARNAQKFREELDAMVSAFPRVHRVEYDALLNQPESVTAGLLEFLGVDAGVDLRTGVHKATPDTLREAIANFDELAASVSGSDMERHLAG